MFQTNALQTLKTVANSGASLTVSNSAVPLAAASVPDAAMVVKVQVQDQDVRMTTDGTTPVAATTGDVLRADTFVYLSKQQALSALFIREGGTDAKVRTEALTF